MTQKIADPKRSRIFPAAMKYIKDCPDPDRRQLMESVAQSYFTSGEQVKALKQIVYGYRASNPKKKLDFSPEDKARLEKQLVQAAARKVAAHNAVVAQQFKDNQKAGLHEALLAVPPVQESGGVIRVASLYVTGAIPRDAEGTYLVEMKNGIPENAWKLAPAGYRLSFWRRVKLVFEVLFMKGNKP